MIAHVGRFLLGRHRAAIDVYEETVRLGICDWVGDRPYRTMP